MIVHFVDDGGIVDGIPGFYVLINVTKLTCNSRSPGWAWWSRGTWKHYEDTS
jgi:hypothetical protein